MDLRPQHIKKAVQIIFVTIGILGLVGAYAFFTLNTGLAEGLLAAMPFVILVMVLLIVAAAFIQHVQRPRECLGCHTLYKRGQGDGDLCQSCVQKKDEAKARQELEDKLRRQDEAKMRQKLHIQKMSSLAVKAGSEDDSRNDELIDNSSDTTDRKDISAASWSNKTHLSTTSEALGDDAYKACPFCGEKILSVAIKCKHCYTDITKANTNAETIQVNEPDLSEERSLKEKLLIAGIITLFLGFVFIWSVQNGNESGLSSRQSTSTEAKTKGNFDEASDQIISSDLRSALIGRRRSEIGGLGSPRHIGGAEYYDLPNYDGAVRVVSPDGTLYREMKVRYYEDEVISVEFFTYRQ